jgi:hypothetical protein
MLATRKVHILVINDTPEILELFRDLLEGARGMRSRSTRMRFAILRRSRVAARIC